jgi:hypothetical protein
MVTPAAFNALLKLVEEPPEFVKFVFATTEPEKVLQTIRSRTHHYPFRLMPRKELTDLLTRIVESEGVAVEDGVLPLVVRAAAGSARDGLSILDQVLASHSASGVTREAAAGLLGVTPDTLLDDIIDAFAAQDAGAVFSAVDTVMERGQRPPPLRHRRARAAARPRGARRRAGRRRARPARLPRRPARADGPAGGGDGHGPAVPRRRPRARRPGRDEGHHLTPAAARAGVRAGAAACCVLGRRGAAEPARAARAPARHRRSCRRAASRR